jgi:hypothetical protein
MDVRTVEGVAEGVRARSSRGSLGTGGSDGNPWVGARVECGDAFQHLAVGGGAVQRVPRTSGVTSAR